MGGNLVETSIFWKELNDEFVYSFPINQIAKN